MEKRFENVQQVIHRAIEQNVFPCAVVEIGNARGPVWRYAEGMRQIEPEALPVNENTIFDMASVSKIMSVTMIALRMIEQGLLSPCDPLGLFWEGLPEKAARIEVQQLLRHSSGLPGGKSIVGFPREGIGEAILKSEDVLNGPGSYEADTRVSYACIGFIVLGELLEKLANKPLDALAQEYVFDPLNMKDTTYFPQGDNIAATSFTEPVKGVVHDYNARYLAKPVGNAGVFSTAADAGKFARMLLRDGEPIISRATMMAANQNHTPFDSSSRGWGFHRFNRKTNPVCQLSSPTSFGHTGWTGTSLMADPEMDLYVVLLTNRTYVKQVQPNASVRMRRYINNAAVAAWSKIDTF